SMGGWTCLGYALRHPERVRALVMASTPGGVGGLITDEEAALLRAGKPTRGDVIAPGLNRGAVERLAGEEAARLRAGKPTRDELIARGINPGAGERMTREQPALAFLYSQIASWRDA